MVFMERDVTRCCLCCRSLSNREPAQLQSCSMMRQYLDEVFTRTPFLWAYLDQLVKGIDTDSSSDEDFLVMCVACDALAMRMSKNQPLKRRMLYVDQIVLFMLLPGKYDLPERRGCNRVLQQMRLDNPVIHHVVPSMLHYQLPVVGPCLTEAQILHNWWIFNDKPFIVGSAALSKKLRRVVSCCVPE
jgi:hypothetical protein